MSGPSKRQRYGPGFRAWGSFVVTAERLGLVVGFWRIGADVVVSKFEFPAEEGRFIVCLL